MKKKPELLKTGNRHSLTVKRFVQNLKENNLHYENKKITQCVFLGVLRLKPVPGVFLGRGASTSTENKSKTSSKNSPNLKKNSSKPNVKNEALTPKSSKKVRPVARLRPSRRPIIKIDLTCEETEVKTEYKFEKLKLNPVRVILHNINRTRGDMDGDIKQEPAPKDLEHEHVENPQKRMTLRPPRSREQSCNRSLTNSPILLAKFADADYCFREALPEDEALEKSAVSVINQDNRHKRTSPRFRSGSSSSNEHTDSNEKVEVIEIQEEVRSRRKTRSSTSSEELGEINERRSKKAKTNESGSRFGQSSKNVVIIKEQADKLSMRVVPNIKVANLPKENRNNVCDVSIRLTRSKSQSPVYCKENATKKAQIRSKSLSLSPERPENARSTRSKVSIENLKNEINKLRKPKLNPLYVDLRVKKEATEERKVKRRHMAVKGKENPVLVYTIQKNVEHEELSDSEVELATPKNSPMKMMRSQRESTENLTEQDERDIQTIQKDSAKEKLRKSKFVMEGEDTQVDIEEKLKKRGNKRSRSTLKKNPTAEKLHNMKKEKDQGEPTKVLPVRKRRSIYSKENLAVKVEPEQSSDDMCSGDDSSCSEVFIPKSVRKRRHSSSVNRYQNTKKDTNDSKNRRKRKTNNTQESPKKKPKTSEEQTETEHEQKLAENQKKPKANQVVVVTNQRVKTARKRGRPKKSEMKDLFATIANEVKAETGFKKIKSPAKRNEENNLSDSDNDSRVEWVPEDYADYKRNFEKQKTKQSRVFKCKICLMLFPSYYMLRKHDKDHQNVEKPYECTLCDETFKDVLDLTAHIKVHKGKHPYQCRKCEKGFWEKSEFEKHQPVHILKKNKPPENRFRCDICAKEFAKLCDMERHLRVHTGEKPCVCNICSKRFQQSHNLSKHLLTHLQLKPFHCEICNKKFGRIDVLNRHLLIHSVEKPFSCAACSKGFIRHKQLEQHTRKKHPHLLDGAEEAGDSADEDAEVQ